MGGLNTYVKQGVPQCLCYIGGGGGLNTYVLWGGGSSILNTYLILGGLNTYVKQGVPQCLCYIGGGGLILTFYGGGGGFLNPQYLPNIGGSQYLRSTAGVTQYLRFMGGGGVFQSSILN